MADIPVKFRVEGEKEYKQAMQSAKQQGALLDAQMEKLTKTFADNASETYKNTEKLKLVNQQIDQSKTKEQQLEARIEALNKAIEEDTEHSAKWQNELTKVQTELTKTQTKTAGLEDAAKDLKTALGQDTGSAKFLNGLASPVDTIKNKFSELKEKAQQTGANIQAAFANKEQTLSTLGNAASKCGSVIKTGLGDAGKAAAEGLAKSFEYAAVGVAASTAAITAAIGAVTVKAVENYADVEQSMGGIEKLYGDDAQAVITNAQNAVQSAGMDMNTYMENVTSISASLINDLGNDTAAAASMADEAMRAASDNANTFGTDAETVVNVFKNMAKENYTTLDNLNLGYAGTKEGMEALIADANEYAVSIGEAGDLSMDSYSDQIHAIELIQEKMGIAGTTAKESATTISGSINALSGDWDNFLTGLATGDIETPLNNMMTDITNIVENIAPVVQTVGQTIADNLPGILDTIVATLEENLPTVLGTITGLLPRILTTIMNMLPQILDIILGLIPTILNSITGSLPMLLNSFMSATIGILTTIIDNLPDILEAGLTFLETFMTALIDNIDVLVDGAVTVVLGIVNFITETLIQLSKQRLK